MFRLNAKQTAGKFIGFCKPSIDEIGTELREGVERNIFDFVLEQRRDLMAIEPRVFADGLDRPWPLARIWHVPHDLGQAKGIAHGPPPDSRRMAADIGSPA